MVFQVTYYVMMNIQKLHLNKIEQRMGCCLPFSSVSFSDESQWYRIENDKEGDGEEYF